MLSALKLEDTASPPTFVAGDDSVYSHGLARFRRAVREVAIKSHVRKTRDLLDARKKKQNENVPKRAKNLYKRLSHWYDHNFSLSLNFEDDSEHCGRFYPAKTMFDETLEVGVQLWGLMNSTELNVSMAWLHGITLIANTLFSPVFIARKMWTFAVAADALFQVVYMVLGYKGVVYLFYPYATTTVDRLPETSPVSAPNVALKLLMFFMPCIVLLRQLPMAWDNVMLARVTSKLLEMDHKITQRKKVTRIASENGAKGFTHLKKHSLRYYCNYLKVFFPWIWVVFMWVICIFIVATLLKRPYCESMHVCEKHCVAAVILPETDPELLNRPLKSSTAQKHCLLGKWQGVLTYRYDDAVNGTQAMVSYIQNRVAQPGCSVSFLGLLFPLTLEFASHV